MEIMNDTESKLDKVICRICLKLKDLENCEKLEGIFSEILEILNLNLISFIEPMICEECSKRLENTFNFKTIYSDTEDFLFPYTNSNINKTLDLQTIYWKERKGQEYPNNGFRICRLCLEPTDYSVALKEPNDALNFEELFKEYLPEVDFYVTDNPIICEVCHDRFKEFTRFLKECTEKEKKLMTYCGSPTIERGTNVLYRFITPNENDQHSDISVEMVSLTKADADGIREELKQISDLPPKLENLASDRLGYGCEICSFSTASKYRLQRHMVVHLDPSMEKLFKCSECPMETNHKYLFRKHIKKYHSDQTGENKYKCTLCTYGTGRKGDFERHLQRHEDISELEKIQCEHCSYETYSKQYMKNHSRKHLNPSETAIYYCETCEYKSIHKHKVIRHELVHKDIREVETFDCHLCDYKAKEKYSLKLHMKIHIDPPDLYHCDICSFKTRHRQALRTHVENLHATSTKRKMFKCHLCDKSFKVKGYRQSHMQRIHNNPQLFPCGSCNYKANEKGNLNAHMRRIHNPQLFPCGSCDYKANVKGNLNAHMRRIHNKNI